jgi:hypothetical protein
VTPPPKDKCPNFKVDEFFCWLRYIWKEVWVLAKGFSFDEQTCSRVRASTSLAMGSLSSWGMDYRGTALQMMATRGISIFGMSRATPSFSRKGVAQCAAGSYTCF